MIGLRPSPVRVSTEAAHKFPRFLLLAVLVLFIASGLLGRDLWSSDEARALGLAMSLAGDGARWLMPEAMGEVLTEHGPLSVWLSAALIKLTAGWLSPLAAMRLTTLFWFAVSTGSIWYGTWFLARRIEAQPVAQAFGREAAYRDYGRLVADTATLFFVSLFGLVVHSHEPTFQTAELALASLAYFGCCWTLMRPYWGPALSGLACGAVVLTSTVLAGVSVLAACLLTYVLVRGIGRASRKIATALVVSGIVFALWPLCARALWPEAAPAYFDAWWAAQCDRIGLIDSHEVLWFVKHFCWYLCPAWPLAARAVWVWRRTLNVTHIALPLTFCVMWLAGCIVSDNINAETLMCVVIAPMCTLSAFGLMSASRSTRSMLECFCVSVFTFALIGLWIYWFAWTFGVPEKMHYSVLRLVAAEGEAHGAWYGVAAALALLTFWVILCVRRLQRRPTAFWHGPWLSAAGLTAMWVTALALFGPTIDSNRTLAHVAADLRTAVLAQGFDVSRDCVRTRRIELGHRTALAWHSGLRLTADASGGCRFTLDTVSEARAREEGVLASYRPRSHTRYRVTRNAS